MKIVDILTYALESGASDLHLSTGSIPMVRINGIMKPLNMKATSNGDIDDLMPQVMKDEQIKRFREDKEIDFSAKLDGIGRFRVIFFNQLNRLAGVFRTIPEVIRSF